MSELGLLDIRTKRATLKVAPSVVSIVSRHVPDDMTVTGHPKMNVMRAYYETSERAFGVSGLIVECTEADDGGYAALILTTATAFCRTNGLQPHEIQVDVYSGDKSYGGQVVACDFCNNLAVLKILSDILLPSATLRGIDDSIPLNSSDEAYPILRPHSDLFKILPGDSIIAVRRSFFEPHPICFHRGFYRLECKILGCKGFSSETGYLEGYYGGPIINYDGEVMGLMLCDSAFLPINIARRWFKNHNNSEEYRQPWVGFKVMELHATPVEFLEQLTLKFPTISSGGVVTKVDQDSADSSCAICDQDIILQCDGQLIRSTLEFFERVWDKVGKSVKFDVLRISDGHRFELASVVGDAAPDRLYRWTLPYWFTRYE